MLAIFLFFIYIIFLNIRYAPFSRVSFSKQTTCRQLAIWLRVNHLLPYSCSQYLFMIFKKHVYIYGGGSFLILSIVYCVFPPIFIDQLCLGVNFIGLFKYWIYLSNLLFFCLLFKLFLFLVSLFFNFYFVLLLLMFFQLLEYITYLINFYFFLVNNKNM